MLVRWGWLVGEDTIPRTEDVTNAPQVRLALTDAPQLPAHLWLLTYCRTQVLLLDIRDTDSPETTGPTRNSRGRQMGPENETGH